MLNPYIRAQSAHYDDTKPIVMTCYVSLFGVRAVLSQIIADALEPPIAYAYLSLRPAGGNYLHLNKEALAIIFGGY